MKKLIQRIEQLTESELQEAMQAIERRYAVMHPEWDVVYIALHKEPELRRREYEMLLKSIERDLQRHKDQI